MEIMSAEFMSALLAIIMIDLVLAGDNAIVIGLAARNVPKPMQRRVILWGTAGAIVVRVLLTGAVVWLLKVPGFLLVGGLALVWIACKLTDDGSAAGHQIAPAASVRSAIQTIVIADAVMGVDNVLAIGGAAHGNMLLVILGLLISIPIVVFGSTLILRWIERFPVIVLIGAGVLGWTAAKMITNEPLLARFFAEHHAVRILLYAVAIGSAVGMPTWRRLGPGRRGEIASVAFLAVWLTLFDWLEVALDFDMHPIEEWKWYYEALDLVMWLGWIPFAIMIHRRFAGSQGRVGREQPSA